MVTKNKQAASDRDFEINTNEQFHENQKFEQLSAVEGLFDLYQQFDEEVVSNLGRMSAYWSSFFIMAQFLLDFIKPLKTGDWFLHLQASEPWHHP